MITLKALTSSEHYLIFPHFWRNFIDLLSGFGAFQSSLTLENISYKQDHTLD